MQKLEAHDVTRKRSPNFTRRENKLLAELIQIYEEQIERKKTDHASNVEKNRAWQELAKDFNAKLGGDPYRSATVLKHRYENIKKDVRRDLRKKHPTSYEKTEENSLENIQTYVNNENIEAENEVDVKEIIRVKLTCDETVDQDEFIGFTSTCASLTSPELKKEIFQDETAWADNNSLKELRKKCFLEEHKLRLHQMKEKHVLELEMIRQEHKERIRMLRQEHDAKMGLLELDKTVGIINKI